MNDDRSINILNEDCLILIFQYLPIKDRIRIERVSKIWRAATLQSWSNFRFLSTVLILESGFEKILSNEELLQLLKRCGPYLRKISLEREENDGDNYELLTLIPFYCKNLRSLEVIPLTHRPTFEVLCKDFNEIRELDVFFQLKERMTTDDFVNLLASKRKLQKLDLYEVNSLDFLIPETVEDLTLRAKVYEQPLSPKIFQNLKRICRLQIEQVKIDDLQPVFTEKHAKTLTDLDLRSISGNFKAVNYLNLLENLQVLRLVRCNSINDKDLTNILSNCQRLNEFVLDHCRLTTTKSLESISNLKHLEILSCRQHVREAPELNKHFKNLRKLKNLQKLSFKCRHSMSLFPLRAYTFNPYANTIEDDTMCDVIGAIPNLQVLTVTGFDFSRNDFKVLRFAEKVTKEKTENVLEIECSDKMPRFNHESSFLEIKYSASYEF